MKPKVAVLQYTQHVLQGIKPCEAGITAHNENEHDAGNAIQITAHTSASHA